MIDADDQLALLQIGAYVAKHLPETELPQSLEQVALIVHEQLGVKIERGDSLASIRNKVVKAIHEQHELEQIGEWFYNEMQYWLFQDRIEMERNDDKIINDILARVGDRARKKQFDEAMKIV